MENTSPDTLAALITALADRREADAGGTYGRSARASGNLERLRDA